MANRYALRQGRPGMWTVYDIFTGLPVLAEGRILVGIGKPEAVEMAELLNVRDAKRRAKAGTSGLES